MSVDRVGHFFVLQCDKCAYYEELDTFQECVDSKKENGWKSKNVDGEWNDFCPDCK